MSRVKSKHFASTVFAVFAFSRFSRFRVACPRITGGRDTRFVCTGPNPPSFARQPLEALIAGDPTPITLLIKGAECNRDFARASKQVIFNCGYHKPSFGGTVESTNASKGLTMCMSSRFVMYQFNKGKPCESNNGMVDGASLTSLWKVQSSGKGFGGKALFKPGVGKTWIHMK